MEKPKQPHSAFMIWLSQHRNQVKGGYLGLKEEEIATKGRELWSFMSRDDKFEAAKAYYEVALNRDRLTGASTSTSSPEEPEKKKKVHKVVQYRDDNEDEEAGCCSSCSGSS